MVENDNVIATSLRRVCKALRTAFSNHTMVKVPVGGLTFDSLMQCISDVGRRDVVLHAVATSGDLCNLAKLHSALAIQSNDLSPSLWRFAAGGRDNLHILQWLHEFSCPPYDVICAAACVLPENLAMLNWLKTHGYCTSGDLTVLHRAMWKQNNVPNLTWLKDNDYPFNRCTFKHAAWCPDNLINLAWLKEQGCPWDGDCFLRSDEETTRWLLEQGCPLTDQWGEAVVMGSLLRS